MAAFEIPAGFRFCPKDDELVNCYLKSYIQDPSFSFEPFIFKNELYEKDPSIIFKESKGDINWEEENSGNYLVEGDRKCYFFTPLKKEGGRYTRWIKNCGTWKGENTQKIKVSYGGKVTVIGEKKYFKFITESEKNNKKNNKKRPLKDEGHDNIYDWLMYEYTLIGEAEEIALCHITRKVVNKEKIPDDGSKKRKRIDITLNNYGNDHDHQQPHDEEIHAVDLSKNMHDQPYIHEETLESSSQLHEDKINLSNYITNDLYQPEVLNMEGNYVMDDDSQNNMVELVNMYEPNYDYEELLGNLEQDDDWTNFVNFDK